jgi:hypothetical protein
MWCCAGAHSFPQRQTNAVVGWPPSTQCRMQPPRCCAAVRRPARMALRCSAEPRYDCRAASPAQACLLHGFRVRMHPSVLPASCGLQAHTHACTPHTHACTPHTHLQLWRQWSASDRDAFGNDVCESLCYRCLAHAWLSKQQRIVLLPARQDLTDSGELRRTADHLHQALRDSPARQRDVRGLVKQSVPRSRLWRLARLTAAVGSVPGQLCCSGPPLSGLGRTDCSLALLVCVQPAHFNL